MGHKTGGRGQKAIYERDTKMLAAAVARMEVGTKRGCTDKVWHETRTAANRAAAKMRAKSTKGDTARLRPYRCATCGLWHIGHHRER